MKKVRIVKRIYPDDRVEYIIQQKHSLFRWWWVDAWINSSCGASCRDSFSTLEEAEKNLCYFDGTPCIEELLEKAHTPKQPGLSPCYVEIGYTGEYWELDFKDNETDENVKFKTADNFKEVLVILGFHKKDLEQV